METTPAQTSVEITANLSGPVQRRKFQGRNYLVAPLTLMVEGVLDGSDGPGLYPGSEITANVDDWNGFPLVVYHPLLNGQPFTARHPLIADTSEVGRVYNAEGKKGNDGLHRLTGEGWFDEELTKKVDPRVHNALVTNNPVELSTGLRLKKHPVPGGTAMWNPPGGGGSQTQPRVYNWEARSFRPDHVAVLPDQVGACSIKDGCGVLVNKTTGELLPAANKLVIISPDSIDSSILNPVPNTTITPSINNGETEVNRTEVVNWLTTNCDCWKGKEALLNAKNPDGKNSYTDEDLVRFKTKAEMLKNLESVHNSASKSFTDPSGNVHTYNSQTGKWETKTTTPNPAQTQNIGSGNDTTTTNKTPMQIPQTMADWLKLAPPDAQATWNNVVEIENREKSFLIGQLTANVADQQQRQAHSQFLMQKTLPELRQLTQLFPQQPQQVINHGGIPQPNFVPPQISPQFVPNGMFIAPYGQQGGYPVPQQGVYNQGIIPNYSGAPGAVFNQGQQDDDKEEPLASTISLFDPSVVDGVHVTKKTA